MPQLTEPDNLPSAPFTGSSNVFEDTTIRQTIKVNLRTEQLRIRISNEFGTTPLIVSRATLALSSGRSGVSTIEPSSLRELTFSGQTSLTISPSALGFSDPVHFSIGSGEILSITLFLAKGQQGLEVTGHPGSRTTSWLRHGDGTNCDDLGGSNAIALDHWYYIAAVMGWAPAKSFCIIGDSITDGRGSIHNMNNRWPDELWKRLQGDRSTRNISPVNLAAGGNRILNHGLGPSAWSRISRDVLGHSNVGYAMIFEGVNDIGTAEATPSAQDAVYHNLIVAFDQIITQIRSFDIPVFGATILPFGSTPNDIQSYSHPLREQTRRKVNDWILNSSKFDYVADFAAAVCNPGSPDRLQEKYDSGDLLHLNPAGLLRLAEVFDISAFKGVSEARAGSDQ